MKEVAKIDMRCSAEFKNVAKQKQKIRNFSSLAEYIRHLVLNDEVKVEGERNG